MPHQDLRLLALGVLACAAAVAAEVPEARAALKAQADAYARLRWLDCTETLETGGDYRHAVRGEPDPAAKITGSRRLVLDVAGKRYRYEQYVAKPAGKPGELVLAWLEAGSAHRLERLDAKTGSLRIRWDSEEKADPGLFDQSEAWNAAILWPLRICHKSGLNQYENRNGILTWIDGTVVGKILSNPRLETAAVQVHVYSQGVVPEEMVPAPGYTLSVDGRTDLGEDPENHFRLTMLRMPWLGGAALVFSQSRFENDQDVIPQVVYRKCQVPGGDAVWLPAYVSGMPSARIEKLEINAAKPADDLFHIDYGLAKDIYDETARMPIVP